MQNDGGTPQVNEAGRAVPLLVTALFAAALLLTAALVALIDAPLSRTGHTWITTVALILGEGLLYGTAMHYATSLPRSRRLFPSYAGMGVIAALYLLVALAVAIVFSWILDVPIVVYGLIQFAALAIALLLMGLMILYRINSAAQEEGT
ncbi:hypothetical protein [Cohnella fermenti]|uniref:Uncharacterized protein n=1 Tax=Cohnella fermenti TaxID=2565925 RepID=A0A4S4C8E5_9BACL|nr:hypothetical protein [Cohnella fermenti]THF84254.1 hypothetical protein E6C55_02880 [Cohnella fermenti]